MDGTESVEGIKPEVAQHDSGSLCEWPFVGVCESNPIELIVMVSNIADNLIIIYPHDALRLQHKGP